MACGGRTPGMGMSTGPHSGSHSDPWRMISVSLAHSVPIEIP